MIADSLFFSTYLIRIVKAVVHKPGDKGCFSNCKKEIKKIILKGCN